MSDKRKVTSDEVNSLPRKRNRDGHDTIELESINNNDVSFTNGNINVKLPTGKTISFEVKGLDTVGSIKVKVQEEEGIPFDQQELFFNKMALENKDILENLRVKNESTFTLMRKSSGFINIFIHTPEDGTMESLAVRPNDTIGSIKEKVYTLPKEDVWIYNDTVLEKSGTFADFGIGEGSTLTHVFKSMGEMEVFIKMYTGKTISMSVKPTLSIGDLKFYIHDEEDIPRSEQVLVFNNMVLGDLGTLFDFGINNNSTLTLMHRPWEFTKFMRIYIKTFTGETITHEVEPSDTVLYIKDRLRLKLYLPRDEQELVFNEMILSDDGTIGDYHIKDGSTLTLMHKPRDFIELIKIFIKRPTGETITQQVKPSDTIGDIKAKIKDKVDIPCVEHELIFNEMVMSDDDTVADYHISKESTLTLMRISSGFMRISVKIRNSETVTLDLRPSNKVRDVKSKIYDMGKISLNDKDLGFVFYNGKHLADSATLADYHIAKESMVRIVRGEMTKVVE